VLVWLSIQIVKIECALREVLGYTGIHNLGQLLVITAPAITSSAGPNTYFRCVNYSTKWLGRLVHGT
jgi:hypothetical protein